MHFIHGSGTTGNSYDVRGQTEPDFTPYEQNSFQNKESTINNY